MIERRLGLRRGVPLGVDQCGRQIELELDLLTAQRRRAGQGRDLCQGARKLLDGLPQRRVCKGAPARLAPQGGGLVDQPGFSAMARHQFGLARHDIGEPALQSVDDPGMDRPARFAQQRAVGGILHQWHD